jgi:hypothetical protein
MEYEGLLDSPGRDAHVTRLRWERQSWFIRQVTAQTLDQMASECAEPVRQPLPLLPVEQVAREEELSLQSEVPPDPIDAYELSAKTVEAGRMAGQRHRGGGSSSFRWTKG